MEFPSDDASQQQNSDFDGLKDACGVFACILSEGVKDVNVANVVYLGLIALQHRYLLTYNITINLLPIGLRHQFLYPLSNV